MRSSRSQQHSYQLIDPVRKGSSMVQTKVHCVIRMHQNKHAGTKRVQRMHPISSIFGNLRINRGEIGLISTGWQHRTGILRAPTCARLRDKIYPSNKARHHYVQSWCSSRRDEIVAHLVKAHSVVVRSWCRQKLRIKSRTARSLTQRQLLACRRSQYQALRAGQLLAE